MEDKDQGGNEEAIGAETSHITETSESSRAANNPPTDDEARRMQLMIFQNQRHSLRVSASNVAAMTGYHPYKNLPELVMQLVYQGPLGTTLLKQDSRLLGLVLVSAEQELEALAEKAGTKQALKKALKIVKSGQATTVDRATSLKATVASAQAKQRLSPQEWKLLQDGVRSAVDTNYGIVHENTALDEYEKQCGWTVRERNAEIRCWHFARSEDLCVSNNSPPRQEIENFPVPSVVPVQPSTSLNRTTRRKKKRKATNSSTSLCGLEGSRSFDAEVQKTSRFSGETASPLPSNSPDKSENEVVHISGNGTLLQQHSADDDDMSPRVSADMCLDKPFFSLLGSIDGIRDELRPSAKAADDDSWVLEPIIVECKHRMKRIRLPPPLYEQIQTCLYCMMYGVKYADIVQVLRSANETKNQTRQKDLTTSKMQTTLDSVVSSKTKSVLATNEEDSAPRLKIVATRISLDDPLYKHRQNMTSIVFPRLRSFVDAVYTIRSEDDLRYRLLAATADPDDSLPWEILHGLCPWLRECDTAFAWQQIEEGTLA